MKNFDQNDQSLNESLESCFQQASEDIFVGLHWKKEHCNPDAWSYTPSTYGVEDAELVGEKHMKLFSDLNNSWTNPGRVTTDPKRVKDLVTDIDEKGINTSGSVIYYDVDTNDRVNGTHRDLSARELSILGWMMQGIRFHSERAKIEFATLSNNRKDLLHKNTTPTDVSEAVYALNRLDGNYDEKQIKKDVDRLGWHLTKKQKERIFDNLIMKFRLGGAAPTRKFADYNTNQFYSLMAEMSHRDLNPEWVDMWENEDCMTLYINSKQFESRVGTIINANVAAVEANKPLHIIYNVSIPEGEKNTLQTNRLSFWTTQMASIETRVMKSNGLQGEMHRRNFAWNHPDCEHRAVAQDNIQEDQFDLIKVRNRDFN